MGRHKNGACFGRAPVLGPRLTCGKSHSENRDGEASSHKLKMSWASELKEIAVTRSKTRKVPQFSSDHPFPYVLVCSTFGTIISLAAVWIVTAHSVAQAMVA